MADALAKALAAYPTLAVATLPQLAGPAVVPGDPVQIGSGGGMGGGGAAPLDPALAQYGPGGLLAKAMVTSTLSGDLPVLKPIDSLTGRVDTNDLVTAGKEIGDIMGKKKK